MAKLAALEFKDEKGHVRVVLEATRDARAKVKWGFVPSTLGDDGDPIEALLLEPGPALGGEVVPGVAVGALWVRLSEANQHEPERDERLILVAALPGSRATALSECDRRELETFFVANSKAHRKHAIVAGWEDAAFAMDAVKRANAAYQQRSQ